MKKTLTKRGEWIRMFQKQTVPVLAGKAQAGSIQPEPELQRKADKMLRLGVGTLLAASLCVAAAAQAPASQIPASSNPANQTAPAATPPSAPTGAGVDAEHYVIGAEDNLQITVWKEPTLSGSVPVRPDGRISLVLVGDMQAAGRTPMQLADDITVKLKKYIQDPNVSVVVMSVNSQKIFLVGEVGKVGPVMMTAGMTALQAISAGGGLTPYANAKKIYILRSEGGKQQKIPFNYKAVLKGDVQGPELKPGDTIVVP
ncbi:MAG TPA: polysaccharide biosynthesis/export family protein [Edaphobacter sp.]